MSEFLAAMRSMWDRDHHADVEILTSHLRGKFVAEPPSLLTGDPDALIGKDHLMVLGINPRWQAGGIDNPRLAKDVEATRRASEAGADGFDRYRRTRAGYFNSDIAYDRYFTRLGATLGAAFVPELRAMPDKKERARLFFTHHAAKFDLLPWWSDNVDGVRWRAATCALEPIAAWAQVLRSYVEERNPRAIVVNGSGQNCLIEALFDGCNLIVIPGIQGTTAWSGEFRGAPMLIVRQLNNGGPGYEAYQTIVDRWREATGDRPL